MDFKGIKYTFKVKPWKYQGQAGWVFVSLPAKTAREIRRHFKTEEEGWGRLKTLAQIGNTEWKTAIWFDTKLNTYLLPLKSDVRKKENVIIDKAIAVTVYI